MARLSTPDLAARLCDALVRHDLPALPADRRADVVAFAARRVGGLPSPLRVGVGAVAVGVAALSTVAGGERVAGVLARRPLPVLGEYVRLLRSLTYAYIWETWPGTQPDGAPGPATTPHDAAPDKDLAAASEGAR